MLKLKEFTNIGVTTNFIFLQLYVGTDKALQILPSGRFPEKISRVHLC